MGHFVKTLYPLKLEIILFVVEKKWLNPKVSNLYLSTCVKF